MKTDGATVPGIVKPKTPTIVPKTPILSIGGNKVGRQGATVQRIGYTTVQAASTARQQQAAFRQLLIARSPTIDPKTGYKIAKPMTRGEQAWIKGAGERQKAYLDQYGRSSSVTRLTAADLGLGPLGPSVSGGRGYYIPWNWNGMMGSLDTRSGDFYVNGKLIDTAIGGGDGGGGGGGGGGWAPEPSPAFNGIPGMNLMLWRI